MQERSVQDARASCTVDLSDRLQASSRPTLKQLLLSDEGRTDLILPDRGQARRRQIDLSSI